MGDDNLVDLKIQVSQRELTWAIHFINNWLAQEPNGSHPEAHRLVSALSNARTTPVKGR